jgi:hypothetical protein
MIPSPAFPLVSPLTLAAIPEAPATDPGVLRRELVAVLAVGVMALVEPIASFRSGILEVLLRRAELQVRRVAAQSVVTSVHHHFAIAGLSLSERNYESVD